jgi:hypothetical protein
LNIKKITTPDVENPGPDLGHAQKGGGVKKVNGIIAYYSNCFRNYVERIFIN